MGQNCAGMRDDQRHVQPRHPDSGELKDDIVVPYAVGSFLESHIKDVSTAASLM